MANSVTFSCMSLAKLDKRGVLGVNSKGNYELVVGGLNVYNSAGEFYVLDQARELFEGSSAFMRRVNRGTLRGEVGHPRWVPGMSERQFSHRILSIYEDNSCCIHKAITLDFERVKDENGNPIVAIISEVSPSGPHGEALRKSLENEGENVCFSIRAFTDDYTEDRINKRILRTIVTFDYVNEPGISIAEKFKSPACEGYSEGDGCGLELERRIISRASLEGLDKPQHAGGMAMESSVLLTANELFRSMNWGIPKEEVPAFLKWGRES